MTTTNSETITLAGGCFWCVEAVYEQVQGVLSVESGYANGQTANPSYEQVCGGRTGHAEVVRVTFDPQQISLREVLAEVNAQVGGRVVTELQPERNYTRAEDYHQHYFAQHPGQGYCAFVVAPKVEKFRKTFASRVKTA